MSILSATSSTSWSIAIKTVGSRITSTKNTFPIHNNNRSCLQTTTTSDDTAPPTNVTSPPSGESASFTLQDSFSSSISTPTSSRSSTTNSASTRTTTTTTTNRNTTNPNNTTFQVDDPADGIATALIGGLLSGFNSNYNPEDIQRGLFSGANNNGTTTTNVASLSGSDGMNLLTALLGLGSGGGGGGGGSSSNNGNQQQQQQQQQRSRRGGEVTGNRNGQGLGAAMMGVLDDGSSSSSINTTAATAAMPISTLEGLVAPTTAAVRSAASISAGRGTAEMSSSSSSVQQPPRSTPSSSGGRLNNRSATTTTNPFNPNTTNNNYHHANNTSTTTTAPPAPSQSAIRAARNRRRATAARLTASDIRIPDPGSMEPVRQGLMTLHTLLRNAELDLEDCNPRRQMGMQQQVDGEEKGEEEDEEGDLTENNIGGEQHIDRHPLNSHRQWYRGQWLDALDTVNQWLEATIVDIVLPSDLLGNYAMSRSCNRRQRRVNTVFNDGISQQQRRPVEAVVSGNDLEGRRRLLLEPRPADDDNINNNNSMMAVYDLLNEGYRPRTDNDGVQLLLIHYNGWPHRWDEWIRSDSPRIRPFRTRTRHRIMSTHASPTPNTVFQAAPPTFIRDESDEVERAELLPELQRVISSVNDVLSSVSPPGEGRGVTASSSLVVDSSHLPWRVPNHGSEYIQSTTTANDHEGDNSDDISDDGYYNNSASSSSLPPRPTSQLNAAQLRQLAPLIDRLGRTLTDAAPHIASLADALPRHSHLPHARPVRNGSESFAAQASRLYFGINSENNDHDGRSEFADTIDALINTQVMEVESTVDPDLTDFVNGMVNTTRGGSSSDTNRDPSSSSLLASYLSSIGAGGALSAGGGDNNDTPRVVRVGGGDGALFGAGGGGGSGSGIDIHIHAIVTGPGMTPTGLDGLVIGDGGTSVTRNASVGTAVTATPELQQSNNGGIDGDEIDHLFSDLYSESPPPVNLHQNQRNNDTENRENLSQIFEECRSIEEESNSIDSSATQPFDGEVLASTNEDAVPDVEEGESPTTSGQVNETNDASSIRSRIGTASSLDTRPVATGPGRRRSSTSFGSRMYRRTFYRLSGSSSRRYSET